MYNSDGAEFDACPDTLGLQLAKTEKIRPMAVERQKFCVDCGPVLARQAGGIGGMSFGEILLISGVSVVTCGVGLLFAIPYAIYRGVQSSGFFCPKCGSKILPERKRAAIVIERAVADMNLEEEEPEQPAKPTKEVLCCPTCGHTTKTGKTLGLPDSKVVTCKECSNTFTLEQGRV
ncbi:MAG: hypothetical protein AAF394_04970 [Planctomycetota bacterium]